MLGAPPAQGRPIYSAQAVRFVFSCAEPLRDGGTDPTFPANFAQPAAAPPGAQAPEPDQAPSCSGGGGSPHRPAEAAGYVSDETAASTQATPQRPYSAHLFGSPEGTGHKRPWGTCRRSRR